MRGAFGQGRLTEPFFVRVRTERSVLGWTLDLVPSSQRFKTVDVWTVSAAFEAPKVDENADDFRCTFRPHDC